MEVNYNDNIVCFDVDLTLVSPAHNPAQVDLKLRNPYSGTTSEFKVHRGHVELLKQYFGRGYFIRVWSHGGVQWAETVVKALNLEKYVDSIETKPIKLVDDLPVEKIFKNVIYLNEHGEENKG